MSKRLHKKKSRPVRMGEAPTQERRRHGKLAVETVENDATGKAYIKRFKIIDECRLDTYWLRGLISDGERQAGLKFRGAYLWAVFRISTEGGQGGGDHESSMMATIGSEELVNKIFRMLSPSQKEVVIAVCGHDEFAGTTAKCKTLKRALAKMAWHWGFA